MQLGLRFAPGTAVSASAGRPQPCAAPCRSTLPQPPSLRQLPALVALPAGVRRPSARLAVRAAAAAAVHELVVQPVKTIEGHVKLPGSKSLSNRILLLAALAEGTTTVENILVSQALAAGRRGGPLGSHSWCHLLSLRASRSGSH